MKSYIEIPKNLDKEKYVQEFGFDVYFFYMSRINERKEQGKIYNNPLKTAYIWAANDKKSHQGYYSTYVGNYRKGRKTKNYGRS